jgi:hypothetical protein
MKNDKIKTASQYRRGYFILTGDWQNIIDNEING